MTDDAPKTVNARAVVVTGASTGIGRATVERLVREGFHVFAGVRRDEDAAKVEADFPGRATALQFDTRDSEALERAAEKTRIALGGRALAGLVVSAGVATPGPFLFQPLQEQVDQLEINLVGAFRAVRAFAPLLGPDPRVAGDPGRVVIVSSLGGKVAQPFASAYNASKHGLEGFGATLRRELVVYGVKVAIVGPAAVKTLIWDKAKKLGADRFDDTIYGTAYREKLIPFLKSSAEKGMPVEGVSDAIFSALTAKNPRLRYSPAQNPLVEQVLLRAIPARVLDWVAAKALGFDKIKR